MKHQDKICHNLKNIDKVTQKLSFQKTTESAEMRVMEENVELCENSSIWSEKAAKTPLSDINTG